MQPQAISEKNYAIVAAATAANGCNCVPYEEVKTYNGWQEAGRQVQRGNTSYVRTTKPYEYKETDKKTGVERTKTRLWYSVLFCKCQTKPKEDTHDAVNEGTAAQVATPV